MKQLLRSWFLLDDYEQMLFQKYQSCKQGGVSISDYVEEFYRLNARLELKETDNQLVSRFIRELQERYREQLSLQPLSRFS